MRREVMASCLFLLASLLMFPACKKQSAVARAPIPTRTPDEVHTPPVVPSPSVEISASPSTIERGQQTELSWKSTHASSIVVDSGVGNVMIGNGLLLISPLESTTYTATAKGPGGETKASTRVTVVRRSADSLIGVTDIQGLQRAIDEGGVRPIFFDYDRAQLTPQAMHTLKKNARWIRKFPNAFLVIQGHCDERGTEEYNLALGDRRSQATQDYLVQLGISPAQLISISYGEEKPFAQGHDENAWRLNRRAYFVVKR